MLGGRDLLPAVECPCCVVCICPAGPDSGHGFISVHLGLPRPPAGVPGTEIMCGVTSLIGR